LASCRKAQVSSSGLEVTLQSRKHLHPCIFDCSATQEFVSLTEFLSEEVPTINDSACG
jgi:hypothetical protein